MRESAVSSNVLSEHFDGNDKAHFFSYNYIKYKKGIFSHKFRDKYYLTDKISYKIKR